MTLPDWQPRVSIVEFGRAAWAKPWGGDAPQLHKLPNGELVVDWAVCRRETPEAEAFLRTLHPDWRQSPKAGNVVAKVWRKADHPNARLLPVNAPRAVRALYKADGQLGLLRGNTKQIDAALSAWSSYCSAMRDEKAL